MILLVCVVGRVVWQAIFDSISIRNHFVFIFNLFYWVCVVSGGGRGNIGKWNNEPGNGDVGAWLRRTPMGRYQKVAKKIEKWRLLCSKRYMHYVCQDQIHKIRENLTISWLTNYNEAEEFNLEENTARIANAVQVTLWLSVKHLNRYLCSHCSHCSNCSQCLLVSTSVY